MTTNGSVPSRRMPIVSVVEDDESMRAALADLLDSAGCRSRAFGSGEEFISSDAAETSDLVITDIQMGKLDGLGLLRKLSGALHSSVPVIVITALADARLERRAVTSGCFAFLRKPFDPETLLAHVKRALASPK